MDNSKILALVLIAVSTFFVRFRFNKYWQIFVHLFLLLLTPWVLILFLASPLNHRWDKPVKCNQTSANILCLTSFEFLFFKGDSIPYQSVGDYGYFLPGFIPLLLLGTYKLLNSKKKTVNLILPASATISLIIYKITHQPYISALIMVPIISALISIGAIFVLSSFKKNTVKIKLLSLSVFIWVTYEAARLYQMIIVHKPFS